MTSVIVDLDVLADNRWRDHMRDIANWDDYHAQGSHDPLNAHAFMLVEGLVRMGCDIGVITHRPAKWAQPIRRWLTLHSVKANRLSCRPNESWYPIPVAMAALIAAEPTPDFVILGDDERLVEAVRATGVFIVQVSRP